MYKFLIPIFTIVTFLNTGNATASCYRAQYDSTIFIRYNPQEDLVKKLTYREGTDTVVVFVLPGDASYTFSNNSSKKNISLLSHFNLGTNRLLNPSQVGGLDIDRFDLIFDGSRPVAIVEVPCNSSDSLYKVFPVERSCYQNWNDVDDDLHFEVIETDVNGLKGYKFKGQNLWLMNSHSPNPNTLNDADERFTPTVNDVDEFERHLAQRNIQYPSIYTQYLFYGIKREGVKYLNVLMLTMEEFDSIKSKKDVRYLSSYSTKRVLHYNLTSHFLENGPFIYDERKSISSYRTIARFNGDEPIPQLFSENHLVPYCITDAIKAAFIQVLPKKIDILRLKGVTVYFILLPNANGQIADVVFGWFDRKFLFVDSELKALRDLILEKYMTNRECIGGIKCKNSYVVTLHPECWQ